MEEEGELLHLSMAVLLITESLLTGKRPSNTWPTSAQ